MYSLSPGVGLVRGVAVVVTGMCFCMGGCTALLPYEVNIEAKSREKEKISERLVFEQNKMMVFVVNHGWHTGVIVPVRAVSELFPGLQKRFSRADYVELGWGDRQYYQADQITVFNLLGAALFPTESVIQVVGIAGLPERYFKQSEMRAICIQGEYTISFVRYLFDSFHAMLNFLIKT